MSDLVGDRNTPETACDSEVPLQVGLWPGPTLAWLVGGGEAVDLWAGWSWIPKYHLSGGLCIPSSLLFPSLLPLPPPLDGRRRASAPRGRGRVGRGC